MAFRFLRDEKGAVAPLLALSLIPIIGAVGAGVDFSRASSARTSLQSALDSAVLYAAKDENSNWQQVAENVFNGAVALKDARAASASFSRDANGNYVGTATASVDMRLSGVLGIDKIEITASSAAKPAGGADNSCLLTLDKKNPVSHVSMLFGGAPNITLTGCSTRSNTSLNCNGHGSGAASSWAAGTANGCSNPSAGARQLPDIYEPLAKNIVKLCGGISGNVDWEVGTTPSVVKKISQSSYTEYHVCGDLTVSGVGNIPGGGSESDSVIVIENGSLIFAADAAVTMSRTAIILTGNGNLASAIKFPQGEGKSASLSISPPQSPDNPWQGISIYQDPALTKLVNNNWGPGATLKADGVIYLPNSEVELQGIAGSSSSKCSKVVTGTFTTKGAVSMDFSQISDGCKLIGMKQWADTPLHLVR